MISEKITGACAALGELAGQVTPEVWDTLHCVRRELVDAADQAAAVEECLTMDMINDFATKHKAASAEGIANG
jgi:hypothetical protein